MNSSAPGAQQDGSVHDLDGSQWRSLLCIWMLFVLSCIVMILRLVSQFKILHIVRTDDILMIIAWILQAIKSAISTVAIYWGLGRHDWQLAGPNNLMMLMRYQMYDMIFGSLCGLFGRLSFATFLLYFMKRVSKKRTYMIWALIGVQIFVTVFCLIFPLVKCAPTLYKAKALRESATCWTSSPLMGMQYAQSAINAASNLSFTILGLSLVMGIHAPGYAKTGLGVLLSFSLLATVADILDIVEVHQSERVSYDYAYRLNTWNNWYSIENAVIIITASMPKVRPVIIMACQRLKSSRAMGTVKRWSNSKGPKSLRSRFFRLTGSNHPSTNSRRSFLSYQPPPSIRGQAVVTDADSTSSTIQRLKSKNSIYSKKSRASSSNNNSSSRYTWHRHHLSNSSGGPIGLSSFPRSAKTRACGIWDNRSSPAISFDQASSTISRDFVPVSTPRLTYQTVVSTGGDDPSVPPPFMSLLPPTGVATPINGSGRTSRNSQREQQQQQQQLEKLTTASNSSSSFTPVLNNNGPRSQSPASFPILQTNHFSIEYETVSDNDSSNHNSNTNTWNVSSNDNSRCTGETSRQHRHQRNHRDVELGWTTMRPNNHQESSSIYNEEDAEALQLHDVGSILSGPRRSSRGDL